MASRPITSIGCPFIRSSSSTTARMVIAMLSPVSPSATGKTLRSLTSERRRSNSASAAVTTRRKRTRLSSGTAGSTPFPCHRCSRPGSRWSHCFLNLLGLEATCADVLPPGRLPDQDADLLEVRVEAPPGGHHRVAAAIPERRPLPTHVTDLWHGGGG